MFKRTLSMYKIFITDGTITLLKIGILTLFDLVLHFVYRQIIQLALQIKLLVDQDRDNEATAPLKQKKNHA